jgi:hypothetical protein
MPKNEIELKVNGVKLKFSLETDQIDNEKGEVEDVVTLYALNDDFCAEVLSITEKGKLIRCGSLDDTMFKCNKNNRIKINKKIESNKRSCE